MNTINYHNVVNRDKCQSILKINELEQSIKDFLVKSPNITQQIIDNVIQRGKSALVKKNADVITATECLVVSRLLCDLSARD
jgi:uncharacterized Fe-S center protein